MNVNIIFRSSALSYGPHNLAVCYICKFILSEVEAIKFYNKLLEFHRGPHKSLCFYFFAVHV